MSSRQVVIGYATLFVCVIYSLIGCTPDTTEPTVTAAPTSTPVSIPTDTPVPTNIPTPEPIVLAGKPNIVISSYKKTSL